MYNKKDFPQTINSTKEVLHIYRRWQMKEEELKYEIAQELGLYDKVKELGWKSLTAKETGRIGGIITKKRKLLNAEKSQQI